MRLPMRLHAFPALLALLLAPACSARPFVSSGPKASQLRCAISGADIAQRLDKGDWMVRQTSSVWKVLAEENEKGESRPPKHMGYLVRRAYRQARGGPVFHIYEVTSLQRKEVLGRIDELGRVTRYEPVRNGTFEERPVTASSLENNVGAILGTTKQISLEATSERRLAFEALDTDGSGALEPAELESMGSRLASADRNGDKALDFAEFDAVDAL